MAAALATVGAILAPESVSWILGPAALSAGLAGFLLATPYGSELLQEAVGYLRKTGGINQAAGQLFGKAMFGSGKDPLLIDIGSGIQTGDPSQGISFDLSDSGTMVQTSWPTATTGILVTDNGTPITSGAQLFGDSTSLPNGSLATDGFSALAALDSNGDGVIDSKDSAYATTGVWVDANQDGVAQPAEVKTLAQLGIASISLTPTNGYTELTGGSTELSRATVQWADGHTSTVAEVGLFDESFNSSFAASVTVSPIASTLPLIQGSGQVRDTQQAATLSSDFASYLQQYSCAGTRDQQLAMLSTLLDKWAATSDFKGLLASNTFAPDSDNYQYQFAGVAQYTWQNGPNDSSLINAPTQPGGEMLGSSFGYFGPEWKVGSNQTSLYSQWEDMVSVLESFNGATLTDGSYFLSRAGTSLSLAGNVITSDNELLAGDVPIYQSENPFSSGTITIGGNTYVNGNLVTDGSTSGGAVSIAGYASSDFEIEGDTPPGLALWPNSARLWNIQVSASQMADLQTSYVDLEKSVYGGLLLQTRLASYLNAISVTTNADGTQAVDVSGIDKLLDTNLASDPLNATIDFVELVEYGSSTLNAVGYDWPTKLASVVANAQASGVWNGVVTELEGGINPITTQTNADGTLTITGMNGDALGLLLGNTMTSELVAGSGQNALFIAGPGSETLDGSAGGDGTFIGLGSDVMIGGTGITMMRAGDSPSTLDASRSQSALLYGGTGNDIIIGGLSSVIQTGDGNDSVSTINGSSTVVYGGSGDSSILMVLSR